MTVTDLRPRTAARPEPTAESRKLADLDAEIAAVDRKLDDPQGWGKELTDARARLLGLRAALLSTGAELTVMTMLAA